MGTQDDILGFIGGSRKTWEATLPEVSPTLKDPYTSIIDELSNKRSEISGEAMRRTLGTSVVVSIPRVRVLVNDLFLESGGIPLTEWLGSSVMLHLLKLAEVAQIFPFAMFHTSRA
jgi:hypothetical protein